MFFVNETQIVIFLQHIEELSENVQYGLSAYGR